MPPAPSSVMISYTPIWVPGLSGVIFTARIDKWKMSGHGRAGCVECRQSNAFMSRLRCAASVSIQLLSTKGIRYSLHLISPPRCRCEPVVRRGRRTASCCADLEYSLRGCSSPVCAWRDVAMIHRRLRQRRLRHLHPRQRRHQRPHRLRSPRWIRSPSTSPLFKDRRPRSPRSS